MTDPKGKKLPANYMDLVYVPAPELSWSVGKDGIVEFRMEHKGFFPKIAQTFFHKPRFSQIRMDAYGSTLWQALDGKNTVFDVLGVMEAAFPDEREKMLNRVVAFLRTLQTNRLIVERHSPQP